MKLAESIKTHIRRSDVDKVFQRHVEKWTAEEQRQHTEYEMRLTEMRSEAQIYSVQSSGANPIAHQFKQMLIQEQQLSLSKMRSEMKPT